MVSVLERIKALLEQRIVVLDGAMGTEIQGYGLGEADYRGKRFETHGTDLKGNNDLLTITAPRVIKEIHRAFLDAGADIVGINNRDLRTFVTDLAVTDRLASMVPPGKIVVSESGVSSRDHVDRVRRAGAHAALVGEALVAAEDVAAKLRELI